jgi:hypothetical protein
MCNKNVNAGILRLRGGSEGVGTGSVKLVGFSGSAKVFLAALSMRAIY